MEEMKSMLDEFAALTHKNDQKSNERREEIVTWIEAHATDETSDLLNDFAEKGVAEQENEIASLRQRIEADNYRLLPIAYIAEKYFGKSRQWLYQRLNGYSVRGKVYTLSREQKETFNNALLDITNRIASIRLA